MDGIALRIEESALEYIVDKALEYKVGARGLRSILEAILTDAMFELPSNKKVKELVINSEYAEKKLSKTLVSKLRVA
jgi:ATP-dependent Clp protease ATP-binding subunit ClpX